jgi:hypothetical protein
MERVIVIAPPEGGKAGDMSPFHSEFFAPVRDCMVNTLW